MEENCYNALPLRILHPDGGMYYSNVVDACCYSQANPSSYFSSNESPEYLMTSSPSPWISSQSQQQHGAPPLNYFHFLAENGQTSLSPSLSSSGFRAMPTVIDTDKVGCVKSLNEVATLSNFSGSENLAPSQVMLTNKSSNEDYDNAALNFPAKVSQSSRSSVNDSRRRKKIAEGIDALQDFLPRSKRGGKAAMLDDVIDYVKHLQFQIKELSQSKLGGESSGTCSVLHEGCGHYPLKEQMSNESLEEMMGKLLEVNPFAATQLLESKGLVMMPITLAEGLHPDV